ncbi:hypothetical protein FRB99_006188, partial [Tulasnella sp. 403]
MYTSNQFWGNVGIGGASSLLMFRTRVLSHISRLAFWTHRPIVQYLLLAFSAGQWAILFYSVSTVKSARTPDHTCVITDTDPALLVVLYAYTMTFDFSVLMLSLFGLRRMEPLNAKRRSPLWRLLFRDAIVFCAVAFSANLIATIFVILRLNTIMEIMFSVPACVLSAVVACRSFVRLNTLPKPAKDSLPSGVALPDIASQPQFGKEELSRVGYDEARTMPFVSGTAASTPYTTMLPQAYAGAHRSRSIPLMQISVSPPSPPAIEPPPRQSRQYSSSIVPTSNSSSTCTSLSPGGGSLGKGRKPPIIEPFTGEESFIIFSAVDSSRESFESSEKKSSRGVDFVVDGYGDLDRKGGS